MRECVCMCVCARVETLHACLSVNVQRSTAVYLSYVFTLRQKACACAQRPGLPQACGCGELACRHLQAGCGAHVACATRLRLYRAFSRTLRSQKSGKFCPIGPKFMHTAVALQACMCALCVQAPAVSRPQPSAPVRAIVVFLRARFCCLGFVY